MIKNYLSIEDLDIYIFNEQVVTEDLQVLAKLPTVVGKPHVHVKPHALVELPSELVAQVKDHVNLLYLQRIFLPVVLDDYEHVLYLDNDTILYESVDQLFNQLDATSDRLIAAVRDLYMYVFSSTTAVMPIYWDQIES